MAALRIFIACALAALLAACDSPRSFAGAHELGVAAQNIESLATEAGWLASQLRERSISAEMAWVHQRALAEEANKAMESLAKPVPRELRAQQEAVGRLAVQLQARVMVIALAVNHPDELEALHREFQSLAQAAHPIATRA